jgi:hypothetical protein
MTRLIVAALAAALLLQGWGLLSSRLLPWPDVYGQMPLPATNVITLSRELPPRTSSDEASDELAPLPAGSTFAPPAPDTDSLVAANGNDWPIYAFGRRDQALSGNSALAYLTLNVTLGVIAALAAALVLRERGAIWQCIGLLLLAIVFIVLLTDVTHAIWMHWPVSYSAVLLTDHLVAAVLAGGAALAILALWPPERAVAA